MRVEEQVKIINKQIDFLNKFKDKFTGGKQEKITEFNYAVECLKDSTEILNNCAELRDSLIESLEQFDKVRKSLEKITILLIK